MRKSKRLKQLITLSLFPFCLMAGMLFVQMRKHDFRLFPNPQVEITAHSDRELGGKSGIKAFSQSNQAIVLSYVLRKGFIAPYAGVSFLPKDRYTSFDLAKYDYVRLKIETTQSRTLRCYINTFIDHHSDPENDLSYLHNEHEIPTWQQQEEYWFALEDFSIPRWWQEMNKMPEQIARANKDYGRTKNLVIQNGRIHETDLPDTIIIREITFVTSYRIFFLLCGASLLLYSCILWIWKRSKKTTMPDVPAADHSINAYGNAQDYPEQNHALQSIIACIGEHYTRHDLTIQKTSTLTGVPSHAISLLLKKKFNVTFPQYLNAIRHAEAKRLLTTSDLKIKEIARLTGHGTVPHFNRVFKKNAGSTPRSYRKLHHPRK